MDDLDACGRRSAPSTGAVLEALNGRLELVHRVNEHKRETGAPLIDAEREAELLRELSRRKRRASVGTGASQTVFAAVLDVMKQELAANAAARRAASSGRAAVPARRIARGRRHGAPRRVGRARGEAGRGRTGDRLGRRRGDAPRGGRRKALDAAAGSLAEAVAAPSSSSSPCRSARSSQTTREVLAAAPRRRDRDRRRLDEARARRRIDDERFVPGHPLAGGATGGPTRAAADLFDGATWFLTPLPASEPARVELVERFVTSLGARVGQARRGRRTTACSR